MTIKYTLSSLITTQLFQRLNDDGNANAGNSHCNSAFNPRFDDDAQVSILGTLTATHLLISILKAIYKQTLPTLKSTPLSTSNYDDQVLTATSQSNSYSCPDTNDFRDAFAEQRRLTNLHILPISREFNQAGKTTVARVNNTSCFSFRPSANARNYIPSYYNHHANQICSSSQNVTIDNYQRVSYQSHDLRSSNQYGYFSGQHPFTNSYYPPTRVFIECITLQVANSYLSTPSVEMFYPRT